MKTFRPQQIIFAAAVLLATSAPAQASPPVAMDLTSGIKSMTAPTAATIMSGRTAMRVTPGMKLTPSQWLAVQQVSSLGRQTLQLNGSGGATGGTTLLPNSASLLSFVIPNAVTVIRDFATEGNMNISGNFINGGKFYAVSTSNATSLASISAANITNLHNALLTTIAPPNTFGLSNLNPNVSLSLTTRNLLTNAGTISSAANLTINGTATGFLLNNAGGQLSAANAITVNAPNVSRTTPVRIMGGTMSAPTVTFATTGALNVNVDAITGLLNLSAAKAVVSTKYGAPTYGTIRLNPVADVAPESADSDYILDTELD